MSVVHARAPTRIDFGGGWTDVPPYCDEHGGCVCNVAIDRYAHVTVEPLPGRIAVVEGSYAEEAPSMHELSAHGGELVKAALRAAHARDVRVSLRADFPIGAGLGGSSAAGIALAGAFASIAGNSPSRDDLVQRSRETEVVELGVAGGWQDHYAAAFGGALGLHFHAGGTDVHRIEMSAELADELAHRCVLAYTGTSRISGDTITAVLDAYKAREPRVTSALASMKELAHSMIDALRTGDLDALGALVDEHWSHQRSLHPTITTPDIERLLAVARAAGSIGGKALGASGGGCVIVLAPRERADAVRAAVGAVAELMPFNVDRRGLDVAIG